MKKVLKRSIKSKRFIGGIGKLKKDGSVVKINGQVFDYRVSAGGDAYILIDNFFGKLRKNQAKRWQMVLVNNIIQLNAEGKRFINKKVA